MLSLTLGCFEMQPLSAAGKNKIPSFDKVNCGPRKDTFLGNTGLLSLNAVNPQGFERSHISSASHMSFVIENSIQETSHVVLKKEVH